MNVVFRRTVQLCQCKFGGTFWTIAYYLIEADDTSFDQMNPARAILLTKFNNIVPVFAGEFQMPFRTL